VVVNPLLKWIWFGFGSWRSAPASRCCRNVYAFALAKIPAEAAATTAAFLLIV